MIFTIHTMCESLSVQYHTLPPPVTSCCHIGSCVPAIHLTSSGGFNGPVRRGLSLRSNGRVVKRSRTFSRSSGTWDLTSSHCFCARADTGFISQAWVSLRGVALVGPFRFFATAGSERDVEERGVHALHELFTEAFVSPHLRSRFPISDELKQRAKWATT